MAFLRMSIFPVQHIHFLRDDLEKKGVKICEMLAFSKVNILENSCIFYFLERLMSGQIYFYSVLYHCANIASSGV